MSRKDEIITGLIEARKKIIDISAGLQPDKQDQVFLGIWSIKDLLAHLIGWDYTNIEAVKDIRAGNAPRVFKHWDSEWAKYNAELVKRHRREPWTEMLDAVRQSHTTLIEFAQTIPQEDIEKDFGIRSPNGSHITVEWFLQFEIDDEGRHYDQVCEWLKKTS